MGAMTITEFLEARIAEEEYSAKQAKAEYAHAGYGCYGPSRVLAECAAKRAILAGYRHGSESEWESGWEDAVDNNLESLAAVYADHPDYRKNWWGA